MILENEMIHGLVPRSRPPRARARFRPARRAGETSAVEAPLGAWDWMHRDYRAAHPNEPNPEAIWRETGISPAGVAQEIWAEASAWLNEPLPGGWIPELVEHAEVVYHHNPRFRRLLRRTGGAGAAGQHWLQAFTRHWLYAILDSRRPHLASRLPSSFASGHAPDSGPGSAI